jgi:galactokinase
MPFAIDRYIVIAGCANGTSEARVTSALGTDIAILDLTIPQEVGQPKWANYIRGVVRGFKDRGHHIPGFDAFILSSVPGGGFGGSTVTLCESSKAAEIAATLTSEYEAATGITPQIFASRPSQGAHLVGTV